MNNVFKTKILPFLLKYSGVYILLKPFYGGIGQIIMFHRVVPLDDKTRIYSNSCLDITPDFLERIIVYYKKKKVDIISLDDIKKYKISKKKFVVFTFDDGTKDNFQYAYPIFKKYNVPFTIYVTTGLPDHTAFAWWLLLEEVVLNNDIIEYEWNDISYKYNCRNKSEKEYVFSVIHLFISEYKDDYINKLFEQIFLKYEKNYISKFYDISLSWDEIIELSNDKLVTLGAHTVSHRPLKNFDGCVLKKEILDSIYRLENIIHKKVYHFSYPHGSYNDECKDILKSSDIKTVVTTEYRNVFCGDKLHLLPRVSFNKLREGQHTSYIDLSRYGLLQLINKLI